MIDGDSYGDLRFSVASFQKTIDGKELHETLDDRDGTRYSSAIYDTANRKINSFPYGADIKKKLVPPIKTSAGQPNVDLAVLGIYEIASEKNRMRGATKEQIASRMLSAAFEHVNNAKASTDPLEEYHQAAVLFDNLEMYDRAIKYYLKATKATDPIEVVDVRLFPLTDFEKRKIERLGKGQREKYLKNRDKKREGLLLVEMSKQEKRIQDSHCRLFRIYLIQAVQVPVPIRTSVGDGMLTKGEQKRLELTTRSHGHLRAAFRAIHPNRRAAYNGMLYFAHDVMKELLPASSPERGAYLHSASGSAGVLQDAHIIILHELAEIDPSSVEIFETLGQRYAEKCSFEDARTHFKTARDLKEANRTPRYASSVPLLRTHGDELKSLSIDIATRTKRVDMNSTQVNIGTELPRSHLLDGRKLALQKIPTSSFGEKVEDDTKAMRALTDYTCFAGRHEGVETRVFIPPSVGWKLQQELDEREGRNESMT